MTNALSIAQLEKSYGAQRVLNGVSFEVPKGAIVGLLGPNGAGKSTLIRSIMGIVEPDAGSIHLEGRPWSREVVRGIGYLPEERGLYKDMRVGDQAVYFARLKGMAKADAVSALRHWFERLEVEGWWDKKVSDISKGMAQKIQFICTVVHDPGLLILDEPLSGFDPINARRIIDEVRALASAGTSILLSTHDMPSVERLCDEVVMLNGGKVVLSGGADALRESGWSGQQEVVFKGNDIAFTNALGTLGHLDSITTEASDGLRRAHLRLRDGVPPGQLLQALGGAVEVNEFLKIRPTMESLFIQAVDQTAAASSAS
ncbi:ATP-binding cassette domain-containing protein [Flavobacteriales bacterium]|nr:ATP-binding cassette domain-containing protein [Flavobacteriales bacterium]MDA9863554.1 ATP-binding cassette domain-containing protein [Flavobacteriales bacterium]